MIQRAVFTFLTVIQAIFLRRLVTSDETWIYHYITRLKQQTKQWVGLGGTAPKQAKTITRKRPHLLKKKWILLQNNVPAHKSIKAMAEINELCFELFSHPPYFTNLASRDFYLSQTLKRWFQRQRFSSNEEVKWESDCHFEGLNKSYYKRGIEILKDRWIMNSFQKAIPSTRSII